MADYQQVMRGIAKDALIDEAFNLGKTADFEAMYTTNDQRVTVDSDALLRFLVALHAVQPLHNGEGFALQSML